HPETLALAARLGLDTGPPPPSADLVVDASGSPAGLAAALDLVRPRGTVVLKTTIAAEHRIDLARAVVNEVNVVGSRCGPFEPALDVLATGGAQVAPLVEAIYPLADAVAPVAHAARPGTPKVLVASG